MLKADLQIFKIKDPRITSLESGRLTLRAFAYTIKQGDWFVIHKDTIYALTEQQFYAAQQLSQITYLSRQIFQKILEDDLEQFEGQDKSKVIQIKRGRANCSVCRYNAYKSQLLKIVTKYPSITGKYDILRPADNIVEYPGTNGQIQTKVSRVFQRFFNKTEYTRKACLDCVQKHVSMAYIKSCQCEQGYPEHAPLMLANLQQAYEQCPKDCQALKDLLMFCIAKSKRDNVPFVPIGNLLYTINISRQETKVDTANDINQPDHSFQLQLNQTMREQLANVPAIPKIQSMKYLSQIIDIEYSQDEFASTKYQGTMGLLADVLLPYSKDVSNLIRNRRIMFRSCPNLTRGTQFDCKDILEAIK